MPYARRETAILLAGDLALLALSLWLALAIRSLVPPAWPFYLEHVRAFVPVYAASILIFFIAGLYEKQTRLVKRILGVRVLGAQAANTALAAIVFFVLPLSIAPKTVLALYLGISVALISLWRFIAVPRLNLARPLAALMVAEGDAVDQALAQVSDNPRYFVAFREHLRPSALAAGSLADAVRTQTAAGVRLVVLDTRDVRVRDELPSLYDAMLEGVAFVEFSAFYESIFDRVPLEHIDHAWLLEQLPAASLPYALAKRTADVTLALAGLALAAPIIGMAALAVRVSSPGPAFIRHERVGRGGVPFRIVKLRTMLLNDHGDPALRARNRVTGVGKLLRKSRVDELPQLWNVLVGDLSFIGPRPELPAIASVYEREIPYYGARHLVVPGLSGWAQIYHADPPRGAADVARTCDKLSYDLYYLKYRSLGVDAAIALKTLRALASFSGT